MAPIITSALIRSEIAASGRLVAAARGAVQLQDPEKALFKDPLLEAMETQLWPEMLQQVNQQLDSPAMYFHIRAHFCNEALKDMVTELQARGCKQLQVVALGAGWDTRPWLESLGLQQLDTTWFSIDVPEALMAVTADLKAVGAQTESVQPEDLNNGTQSYSHPLQASRICMLSCDLRLPPTGPDGLMSILCKHGFDASVPTVWLCEGILYYVTGERMASLLEAMAANCGPHSMFVADVVNDAFLQAAWGMAKQASAAGQETKARLVTHFLSGFPAGVSPATYLGQHGWVPMKEPEVAVCAGQQGHQFFLPAVASAGQDSEPWKIYLVQAGLLKN